MARQIAQSCQWKYSAPWTSCSVYEWVLAGGLGIFSSLFHVFEPSLVWRFEFSWEVGLFQEYCEIWKNRQVLGSTIAAWGPIANWLSGGEKNSIVHSLFCIFIVVILIIIIIIISSSSSNISIYFVVFLNCLYLKPQVLPFVHFSSQSCWGRSGRVSAWLLATGLNHDSNRRAEITS